MKGKLALFFLLVAVGLLYRPQKIQAYDRNCSHNVISFNDGFNHYVTAEGVGAVGLRLYANLHVYDLCDHGAIIGTIGVYGANISAKGGSFPSFFHYQRSSQPNVWSSGFLTIQPAIVPPQSRGWTFWNVQSNNVGMSRQTYFRFIHLGANIVFNNVPFATKVELCTRTNNGYQCHG